MLGIWRVMSRWSDGAKPASSGTLLKVVLKIRFCKRGSVNVRFPPKATGLLRRREMSRWAMCGLPHRSMVSFNHQIRAQQE